MRADRLVATLLLMQARGRVTAAELAGELEVSVATARRDLEALSAAGVPVYPQPGRGGGWSLLGGARTDLTGLTAAEAQALFALAGPGAAIVPEVRSALRKLVQALPGTFRADAEAAAEAVVIDPAGWGERETPRPPLVEVLQDAVVHRRTVKLTYQGRARSERLADPLGLAAKDDVWYLIAGTGNGQRTFRADRIVSVEVTGATFERPPGFDLATAWGRVVEEMEQRRALVTATVLVPERWVRILRDHFGRHFEIIGPAGDGRVRVRVSAHMARGLAEQLAGWGAGIEVEGPPEVQAELARIGRELIERYER
jgi:predicted DNA-binding transcriptional regulator YafY